MTSDPAVPTSPGAELIAAERQRQIEAEGWTPEHDDELDAWELSTAARCYSLAAEAIEAGPNCVTYDRFRPGERPPGHWPWAPHWWKPSTSAIRNLVKAGALIAAEIDRLQRAYDSTPTPCSHQHPHPEHPCGREIVAGVTLCPYCGHLDGSAECDCWTPATQAHLDSILCDVMERTSGMTDEPSESSAPCDWDWESYCVEEGCRSPAAHERLTGTMPDGTEVVELVCCHHAIERTP